MVSIPKSSRPLGGLIGKVLTDSGGTATIEFGLVVSTLVLLMLNGVEVARYYFAKMELQNAVQMAGNAVWSLCDTTSKIPTSTNCSGRATKLTNALQSTSLGSNVTLSSGYPTEAYYCTNSTTLTLSSAGSTKPSGCGAYGGSSSENAGYYIKIQAQYTYSPLFTTISVGNLMPPVVTATSITRLQ